MISKKLHWQLVFRVFFIAITIAGATYFVLKPTYVWAGLSGFFTILQCCQLIYYLNTTNRKIAFYIKALINEDFTLNFDTQKNDPSLNELNIRLNQLNDKIQRVYMKNETQEKYYQQLLKQAEIGVLTINEKGHILFANPKAESLLNYSPLNHVKQLDRVSSDLYRILSKPSSFDRKLFKLTNEREVKQLALKSTGIIVKNEQIQLITLQDIRTELDHKETDSWMKLIRVLTHEMMNSIAPITSISDSLLQMNESVAEDSSTKKGLEVIKNQSDDIMRFVQSYRSFLNIPKPDQKIVSVSELFGRLQLVFKDEMHSKNIVFQVKVADDVDSLFIDEQQFSQVLINLLKNAMHAVAESSDPLISLEAYREKEKIMVSVTNNGVAIPEEELSQIFVPFFTTKEKGTGIGLSLSKQIVQLHGGSLEVFSQPEETTFRISMY